MTSLVKPLFKKIGLAVTAIGLLMLIAIIVWSPEWDEPGYIDKVLFPLHLIIIFGLMMLTFSKEKIDDEGVQKIRYFVTKFCFRLLIVLIPTYLIITNLDRMAFSAYPIFYIIEGMLILFQILFRIGLKQSPKMMYSEPTKGNAGFIIVLIAMFILIVTVVIDLFTHTV
jgi:cell division protein FtsW (lipid II flippase)